MIRKSIHLDGPKCPLWLISFGHRALDPKSIAGSGGYPGCCPAILDGFSRPWSNVQVVLGELPNTLSKCLTWGPCFSEKNLSKLQIHTNSLVGAEASYHLRSLGAQTKGPLWMQQGKTWTSERRCSCRTGLPCYSSCLLGQTHQWNTFT